VTDEGGGEHERLHARMTDHSSTGSAG